MMSVKRPYGGALIVAMLSLLLASCLLMPGKFTSSLDIRKDGRFSFTYTGEIHMLALSKMAQDDAAKETFEPEACHKEDTGEERPCTVEETAEQKRSWDESQAASADRRKRDAEQMRAVLGGIDPSNPQAAEELAARLRRQAGWKRVTYKGDGLYDVDFALSGRLDHDFTFPTIERFPMANAFVQIGLRSDGTVRVDAPGFAPATAGEPFRSMGQSFAAKDGKAAAPPPVDGRFTLTTDGAVLANNTDEGPQADPTGQKLAWTVNVRTPAPPTALIRLTR